MNLQKMQNQLYRNVPDNAEKDFEPIDVMYDFKVQAFMSEFGKKMRAKHGSKLHDIAVFTSRNYVNDKLRVQLAAILK